MKPAREPASSRPKPCASLEKPHESFPFAAPCGPRRKKNDRGQTSAFSSETSWFKIKHNAEGNNVRRTLHTKRKRQWYKTYSEKATSPNKQREKDIKKHVWLSGRPHIEGRLNDEPRLQRRKHKDEKRSKTKQT